MMSLEKMKDLKPAVIFPAHGSVITNPVEKLQFYISHRLKREKQIMDLLKQNPDKLFTPLEIMKNVYDVSAFVLVLEYYTKRLDKALCRIVVISSSMYQYELTKSICLCLGHTR